MSTRIVLADDHAMLREMLAEHLAAEPDMEVVAVVPNAAAALEAALAESPDLVVLDIDMPGLSPFHVARRIHAERPATRVVFLSAYLRDHYVQQALDAGAAGYLVKDETPEAIVQGLRMAARGRTAFSPAVRARLSIGREGVTFSGASGTRLALLTPRETETLRYLASGLSRKEIARTMGISNKTVEQHCEHLMHKLDIHDRVELTRFAIREGLLEP
ncbi:response regulator transcription factor [Wenzhouxiangella sp. XN24]|uniref:response regulator n=1 Tax=Wenzhouxiangella sp. XN24 TaxID=2713569 RepID=UPI0013EC8598|nr:response regulator transcription factor [Wenzhouxiangella sp. XN24]NGX17387.1 response regulator transcription factor [Wenzhouxiangella sp. XN24]